MANRAEDPITTTDVPAYAERLAVLSDARWKRVLSVQAPYRWNVRRLGLGRTLDVGCGIGRNLAHLGGHGVGVDHNPESVAIACRRGLTALTVDDFLSSPHAEPGAFDSLLAAHLIEHLQADEALEVIGRYLKFVRPGGLAVFITPQERGYASDASHVRWTGFPELHLLAGSLALTVERSYSFPFPRAAGRLFTHNEFVVVTRLPA